MVSYWLLLIFIFDDWCNILLLYMDERCVQYLREILYGYLMLKALAEK